MSVKEHRPPIEDRQLVGGGGKRQLLSIGLATGNVGLPGQAAEIQGELVDLGRQAGGREAGKLLILLYGLLLRDASVGVDGHDSHGKEDDDGGDKRPREDPSPPGDCA